MKLDEEKVRKRLLSHGLSTRRSRQIAEDLAGAGDTLFKREKKGGVETKDVSEVVADKKREGGDEK